MDKMKISEKQLEDWICEHPEETFWSDMQIIGRQISLRHGRLDIMAFHDGRTVVIELKARPLQEKDIAQILRYVHDVTYELQRASEYGTALENFIGLQEDIYCDLWEILHGQIPTNIEGAVLPVLIGPSVTEEIEAAASAANIHIRLWKVCENTREIEFDWANPARMAGLNDPMPAWALRVNDKINEICKHDVELIYDHKLGQLFGFKERWPSGLPYTLPFVASY